MFWDTTDYWMDTYQTNKVKAYRRKSNYYEGKNEEIQQAADTISRLLNQAGDYGFSYKKISTISDNILEYRYSEAEFAMLDSAQRVLISLQYELDILYQEKEVAYSLYCEYYNLAIQEDY